MSPIRRYIECILIVQSIISECGQNASQWDELWETLHGHHQKEHVKLNRIQFESRDFLFLLLRYLWLKMPQNSEFELKIAILAIFDHLHWHFERNWECLIPMCGWFLGFSRSCFPTVMTKWAEKIALQSYAQSFQCLILTHLHPKFQLNEGTSAQLGLYSQTEHIQQFYPIFYPVSIGAFICLLRRNKFKIGVTETYDISE